jgi:hypothetical protein
MERATISNDNAAAQHAVGAWRDSIAIGLATLLACSLLVRGVWHGLDAYSFLSHLERGVHTNPRHPLYLPLAGLVVDALRPFGVSVVRAAVFASSLGAALGALLFHRAFLEFGLARRDAAMASASSVACFGILYYGSMVEIHAVFLMPAGLSWLLFARYLASPSWNRAWLLGIATGFAAATHATGHLLLVTFGLFALLRMRSASELRLRLPHAIAIALPHAFVAWMAKQLVLPDEVLADRTPEAGAASYFAFLRSLGTDWAQFPRILWHEWLMPLMPLSLLAPLALLRADSRRDAIAFCAALAVYFVLTTMLLAPLAVMQKPEYLPPFATYEFGAYFLPLCVPAAMLALRVVPQKFAVAVPLLGVVSALTWMFSSPRAPSDLDYGRDALSVLDQRKARIVIGGYGELDSILQLRPECGSEPMHAEPNTVLTVYGLWLWLFRFPEYRVRENVFVWFDVQVQQVRAKGGQLLITGDALQLLRGTKDGLLDALANEHIPQRYTLTPIEQGRFRGYVVEDRR